MVKDKSNKKIDPHLNNLIFSLYNFAKARKKSGSKAGGKERVETLVPLKMLKMLKRKIGSNLTADEEKLIDALLEDLEGKPKKDEGKVERISLLDQQDEILERSEVRAYKFSSIVDEAFSMVKLNDTMIQIMLGDLTVHPAEVIVSPDTTELWMEQGVASIIRLKGGDSIRKEARQAGSVGIGDVVVTNAGDLTQRYIFHTAIMVPSDDAKRIHIQKALETILNLAEKKKVRSIAIPALGISSSKFPYDAMAKIMIQKIFDYILVKEKTSIGLVIISLFNREAYNCFIDQFRIVAAANALKVDDFK